MRNRGAFSKEGARAVDAERVSRPSLRVRSVYGGIKAQHKRYGKAQVWQHESESCVESQRVERPYQSDDGAGFADAYRIRDSPAGIDDLRNARGRRARDISTVFHRPHRCHGRVLLVLERAPAHVIVCRDKQHLGPVARYPPRDIAVVGVVAYENAYPTELRLERRKLGPGDAVGEELYGIRLVVLADNRAVGG